MTCNCPNCADRARWEIRYQIFLQANPGQAQQEFIQRMRKDDEILVCLRKNQSAAIANGA